MEMNTGMTTHIVLLTGISEEVGLGTSFDAGVEER